MSNYTYKQKKIKRRVSKKKRRVSKKKSRRVLKKKSRRVSKKKSLKGGSLTLGLGIGALGSVGLGTHFYYKNKNKKCKLNAYKNYKNEYENNYNPSLFNNRYNSCEQYVNSCIGNKELQQLKDMKNNPKASEHDKQYYIDNFCQNLYMTKSGIKFKGHIPKDFEELII